MVFQQIAQIPRRGNSSKGCLANAHCEDVMRMEHSAFRDCSFQKGCSSCKSALLVFPANASYNNLVSK